MKPPAAIELYEDGRPYLDEVYVRGHVDDAAYLAAIRGTITEALRDDDDQPEDGPREADVLAMACGYLPTVHTYARWITEWETEDSDRRRVLVRSPKGRGAFAVTVGWSGAIRRAWEVQRAKDEAHRAELLTRYSGIEIVSGPPFWRFKAPGLAGLVDAQWREDGLHLSCDQGDVAAWGVYRAGVRK